MLRSAASPHIVARVADVELTEPIRDLASIDDSGRWAGMAWLLVRVDRTPLGTVTTPMSPAGLDRDEVIAAISTTLGESLDRLALAHGVTGGISLDPDGFVPPWRAESERRRAAVLRNGPELTVVVCTRDRPASLARCLDSVLAQAYPRFRVLVVDNSSTSSRATRDVAAAVASDRVETLVVPRTGLSHARNAAVGATTGEHLAWIDDDEVADAHWLSEIAQALVEQPAADAVCGAVVPATLDSPAQLWLEQFGGLTKGRGFTPAVFGPGTVDRRGALYPLPPFGAGANLATRAGVIEQIGGFDPALGAGSLAGGGEDTVALARILLSGGTIAYHPAALTRHFHRSEASEFRRQLIGYGTGLTAGYASLLRSDPRLLLPLLGLLPRAARDLFGDRSLRTATLADDFPRDVLHANLRGMLAGPVAYVRGRYRNRR
ncbi:MAG TPA: glycosyltransferase [Micromonosporaceae bacterium]|nr:glycosyltransferase [Micromonosporaceae bacterium]